MQEQELIRFEILRAISQPVGRMLSRELSVRASGHGMNVYTINEEALVYLIENNDAWFLAVVVSKSKI